MEQQTDSDEERYSELPDELIRALRDSETATQLITSRVDREIALLASEQFDNRDKGFRRLRPALAAAAALVAVISLMLTTQERPQPEHLLYSDVDNSGQVDIADVFMLARHGNSDGDSFTEQQLDAFARSVVSLGSNGDSS